ncbi:nucleotidyltransferase domain-containing protein [Roseomonas terrae]|uniref:Nucleotidyltransferase domain-containing protein n=1 Tax=Neoroseomonas terrae TaxID=424799 RepID=A0ABS5ECW2_9PROT|nr:nucleotidyltransferase domain-containing protein [Neoroseomonas terrae]MBR0648858.1 nucleotidyltransferase domain-containing protein [Neoroseomonas terrae]
MSNVDIDKIKKELDDWSKLIIKERGAEKVFLFGSLVYRNGAQFTPLSDIDIVIKFGTSMNALQRAIWLEQFLPYKKQLELTLLQTLERRVVEPFASVVAVTQIEIDLDIQKENQPSFYSSNIFIDLPSGTLVGGLPGAASSAPCDRLLAGSISATQKVRHQFLSVAANNRGGLPQFDGDDRVPKPIMRAAAMARALADGLGKGAEYDTRLGLDHLTKFLLNHEADNEHLGKLNQLLSERGGARGEGGAIKPFDQLLLAEIVLDLAVDGRKKPPGTLPQPPVPMLPPVPPGSGPPVATAVVNPKSLLPRFAGGTSLSFFFDRFQQAFPGTRSTAWFEDTTDAIDRLGRLLQAPLRFSDAAPIWWWRDGNLDIQNFDKIDTSVVLINHDELSIRRIAAVPGPTYKWNFVYVEADPMVPTGLYDIDPDRLKERVERNGYASEEYGLYAGSHSFSRSEYDDGGTYIDGKYVDTTGRSALRIRYLTSYNFIIAPKDSPINNVDFDRVLAEYLNRMLKDDSKNIIEELSREVAQLPLRRFG